MVASLPTKLLSGTKDSEFWQRHVEQYERSNMTKRIYAEKHQLIYNKFLYWHRKLTSQSGVKSSSLIPVTVTPSPSEFVLAAIENPKGLRLQIYDLEFAKDVLKYF